MTDRRLGIIFNGATGSLARQQHLRALLAMRHEGGLPLAGGGRVLPEPLLVGRSADRLRAIAAEIGLERWSTDLDAALASSEDTVFFDAAATGGRFDVLRRAIAAGKHIYAEKPVAGTFEQAMTLVRAAEQAGVKNGTVQDKLFLPGFNKLRMVRQSGFFGRILEVRLEMGRWIFDGELLPGQRPSWNYRRRDGGGLVLDMFPHWRYMLEGLVGTIKAVNCTTRTQIPRRRDEAGALSDVDVEDAVFAQMELEDGVIASVNCSWSTRVRRESTIVIQIDGTKGSAVAGPQECFTQADIHTPKSGPTADSPRDEGFFGDWQLVPDSQTKIGSYRAGWEMFIRHVCEDAPFPFPLIEGAKGLQLVDAAYRSSQERRWVNVPPLA
jgi:predicted dehydrogenase